jgi:TetR/AcrR family transcriptional regulator
MATEGAVRKGSEKARRGQGRPPASAAVVEAMRSRIVEAAGRTFGAHGLVGTTVEGVLKEAGISRPTFYKYFRNLEEVLGEVVRRANEDLKTSLTARVGAANDPIAQLETAVDAYLEWGERMGVLVRVLYSEAHLRESPVSKYRERTLAALTSLFALQAKESGRAGTDPLVFDALVHVMEHLGSGYLVGARGPAGRRRCRAAILRIVLATLAEGDDVARVPPLPKRSRGGGR